MTSGLHTACSTAEQNALSVLVDTDGDRTHELRSAGAVPFLLGYWPMIFSSAVGTRTRISDLKGRWTEPVIRQRRNLMDTYRIRTDALWVQTKDTTTILMAQILVLRPGFEPGLSDRKSDGLNRWPNGAYFVVPPFRNDRKSQDFQSRA